MECRRWRPRGGCRRERRRRGRRRLHAHRTVSISPEEVRGGYHRRSPGHGRVEYGRGECPEKAPCAGLQAERRREGGSHSERAMVAGGWEAYARSCWLCRWRACQPKYNDIGCPTLWDIFQLPNASATEKWFLGDLVTSPPPRRSSLAKSTPFIDRGMTTTAQRSVASGAIPDYHRVYFRCVGMDGTVYVTDVGAGNITDDDFGADNITLSLCWLLIWVHWLC